MSSKPDAVVVGAGPNGLAAAITLARAGQRVVVLEAGATPGGGCRTAELTEPGFLHDVCSAIHPLAAASPFFRSVPLERFGVRFLHPEIALAHPLDGGRAAVLKRSLEETAVGLGTDERAYRKLMTPFVRAGQGLIDQLLGPLRFPRHPIAMARFGLQGFRSAAGLCKSHFETDAACALVAGSAAHSMLPLDSSPTGAVSLMLNLLAHHVGWPVIEGGSQRLVDALVAYLGELGGTVEIDTRVRSWNDLPAARAVLFDLTPRQVVAIAGDRFPARYRRRLERYRYGPGVFKVDWALSEPVPWAAEAGRRAGTLHVGGGLDEIVAAERDAWSGRVPESPFVLIGQQSLLDPSRAPEGRHTLWAYCHVPHGSDVDMTERIESQIERFAPGFRDVVLARHTMSPAQMTGYNANYIGGDINGGTQDLRQLFTRPVARLDPYSTPDEGIFFCSSSAPPGGGVHGMAGYFAAKSALRHA
ncbi:MAG TPA: NAD(P)/FAD-dependent oxidoreductase [Actinomycetota bacterium]|nr:NAD(P)/FAD-dependent oxidoreductase [Actinomycetota bacterium]